MPAITWTTPVLTKEQLPYVPFKTTHTVGECYTTFIEPLLPKAEVVRHWHDLLLAYVAQPAPILFIRRYASAPKKQYDRLRRGFLTVDPTGFGYAYCDNYFPQLIFAQVLAGRTPSLAELNAAVENRSFPVSAMLTEPENKLKTFGRTTAPALGAMGWKLSHLYSVNQGYDFDYKAFCAASFPRGEYAWWNTADKIHRLTTPVSAQDRTRMTAHFLRAVHPANYFLSPSKRHQLAGTDVGESALLIAYVRERFRELYPDVLPPLEPHLLPSNADWVPVTAASVLALTVQNKSPRSQKAVAATVVPKRITIGPRPTKVAYPITYSTTTNPAASAQEFKQALLQQRKATITRTFNDGTAPITTIWNAGNFIASANLITNIRGRFRGAESERISALHVAVAH